MAASDFCEWCGRSFGSKHPLAYVLKLRPDALLPRRSARSHECTLCCEFIRECYPRAAGAGNAAERKKLLATVTDGDADEFHKARVEFEKRKEARGSSVD